MHLLHRFWFIFVKQQPFCNPDKILYEDIECGFVGRVLALHGLASQGHSIVAEERQHRWAWELGVGTSSLFIQFYCS